MNYNGLKSVAFELSTWLHYNKMITNLIIFIVFILSVVPAVQWYKKRSKLIKIIEKIPGKKAYPLIGTSYEFFGVNRKGMFDVFHRNSTAYPYIHRSWIGLTPEVMIRKAEYVEKVIGASKNMEKGRTYDFVKIWLGDGLLLSSGERWFKHRKIITPTFHFSILESFCDIFNKKSAVLVDKLNEKTKTGEIFNIQSFITNAALEIISEAAMGISIDVQGEQKNEYVNSVYELSELVIHRSVRPYLCLDFVYNLTAKGKRFNHCLEILHSFTKKVIANRKRTREENKQEGVAAKKKAFLDLLLDANENKNILTDQDIREEVDTFMFEGHDTTAAGISWTLYMLGSYPSIQEKVFDELESIFDGTDRPATLSDLNEMKYLERVIKESMRIFTPVPNIGRILSEDVQLDEYVIPKGTSVSIQIYYMHRDPRFFPEPEKFDPDRFLPENLEGRNPFAYIPFSAGPRNCIGQKFAMYEEKAVLSSIIRNFKVKSVEKRENLFLMRELILKSFNGMRVTLEKRCQ